MLDVDTLSLVLPAGFARRAARIGRLLGEELSLRAHGMAPGRIDTLVLPPLRIEAGWSDRHIASHVAAVLARRIATRSEGDASCSTR